MRPFAPFVDGYWDVENQLAEHIKRRAIAAAAVEAEAKAQVESITDFEKRRSRIKEVFYTALGGLPTTDAPLNAEIVGVIQRSDYSIEKVIFESLPQFLVTGNIYLPATTSPAPAILFLCGHAREAKAYPVYQKVCQALVKAGFVVLAVDPLGQGERMGYVNPQTRKLDVEWGVYEHSHAGLQCTLAGFNIARYFIHDAIRSLDYLCSRPEVDSHRIGVTGNSGGGTQTSYLMMADERIKAAIPCTYITAREHYLLTGQAHDAEQNLYGAFLHGLNYDDLLTALAPKPVQLGAVASDFFTIEGTLQSAKRARKVYQLYDKPENFRLIVASGTHEYADLLREETVAWFRHHLQGVPGDELDDVIAAQPWERPGTPDAKMSAAKHCFDTLPEQELWCTPSGQISLYRPTSLTVFDSNRAEWKPKAKATMPLENSIQNLQREVYGKRASASIWTRCIESGRDRDLAWKKIFFFSEPDIVVTGIWISADPNAAPWVVLLEEGTNSVQKRPEFVKQLARDKGQIFLFDVRGIGAVEQRPINRYRLNATYGTEFTLNYNAIMLEDSLLWMRAFDVTRALSYVHDATSQAPSLFGEGWLGLVGLVAAAVWEKDAELSSLEFERLLYNTASIIDERFHMRDHRIEAFKLAMLVDIPSLLERFQDRAAVNSWVDGRGRLLKSPPASIDSK